MINNNLLIFDGNNAVHRANISFGKKSVEDHYTITYNFFRQLKSLLEQFKPSHVIFAWEGYPSFRYNLYPNYKANRLIKSASNQNLDKKKKFQDNQLIIKEILSYLGIVSLRAPEYEADDLIYSLLHQNNDCHSTVISSDTDFIQILQDENLKCSLYNPIKKEFIQPPKYPYVVHKSLVGDKSDNINRIVSDKKALSMMDNPKLLDEFLDQEENLSLFSINLELIKF